MSTANEEAVGDVKPKPTLTHADPTHAKPSYTLPHHMPLPRGLAAASHRVAFARRLMCSCASSVGLCKKKDPEDTGGVGVGCDGPSSTRQNSELESLANALLFSNSMSLNSESNNASTRHRKVPSPRNALPTSFTGSGGSGSVGRNGMQGQEQQMSRKRAMLEAGGSQ